VTGAGHSVQVRWNDLDALGHVGHTAVLVLLEEGRDAMLARNGIDEYVVGRCSVTFRREIGSSVKSVTVQVDVRELGRSSLTTSERIVDEEGDVFVEAEFRIVLWDAERRAPRPISDSERASLEEVKE
jgi:acyl-CoA thioester hydrolase